MGALKKGIKGKAVKISHRPAAVRVDESLKNHCLKIGSMIQQKVGRSSE